MLQSLLIVGALLALLSGLGWLLPGDRRGASAWRPLAGLALAIVLLYGGTPLVGLTAALTVAMLAGAIGWVVAWRRRPARRLGFWREWRPWLLLILSAATVSMLILPQELPRGFDPIFHSMLARTIAESGALASTWEPYEPVQVNYPLGPHLLMAAAMRLGGGAVPDIFHAFIWWFGATLPLMIYLLARRLLRDRNAALAAALLAGLVARCNTPASFVDWGGLPTLLDYHLFLAFLLLMLSPRHRLRALTGGVLLAAIIMTHHLAALIIATILGTYLLYLLAVRPATTRTRTHWRFLLGSLGVQVVIASPFLVSFLPRAGQLDDTTALTYQREPIMGAADFVSYMGWPWWVLIVAGLLCLGLRRRGPRQSRLLLCWCGSLLLAYLLLGQLYPRLMLAQSGQAVVALTPSRWLAALTLPVALAAAPLFRYRWAWLLAPLMLVAMVLNLDRPGKSYPAERMALYRYLDTRLPEDAFVLNALTRDGLEIGWQAVFCRRESYPTQLPASEPTGAAALRVKQNALESRDLAALYSWVTTIRGKRCFILAPDRGGQADPRLRLVETYGSARIYELIHINAAQGQP